jgi:hypothetical protein
MEPASELHIYDPLPLILNDIKKELGLILNEYTIYENNGIKYLKRYYKGTNLTLKEFAKFPYPYYDINDKIFSYLLRKCLAFRYIFFLDSRTDDSDSNVYIGPIDKNIFCDKQNRISALPISNNEYSYDITNISIPKYIIDRYFDNDMNIFNEYLKKISEGISPEKIKDLMVSYIKRYDEDIEKYMPWIIAVYDRWNLG